MRTKLKIKINQMIEIADSWSFNECRTHKIISTTKWKTVYISRIEL